MFSRDWSSDVCSSDLVSIGYITDPAFTVEIPKGKTVKIDGIRYSNGYSDGIPLLIRTWWKVRELSLVAIGADARSEERRVGRAVREQAVTAQGTKTRV